MNNEKAISPSRTRSPNYPYLPLPEAIKKADLIYEANDSHFASVPTIARNWKYTEKSSSLAKVIGALAHFGLIEEKGKGESRQIKVSNRYLDLHMYPPGSDEYERALKDAAVAPALHAELIAKYGGKLPPKDDAIRIYLLREREEGVFNRSSVDQFIEEFRETLKFAKLDGDALIPSSGQWKATDQMDGRTDVKVGDFIEWSSDGKFQPPAQVIAVQDQYVFVAESREGIAMEEVTVVESPHFSNSIPNRSAAPLNPFYKSDADEHRSGQVREETNLDEGPVRLTWPEDLSPESVEDFEYWVTGLIRKAKRRAGLLDSPL